MENSGAIALSGSAKPGFDLYLITEGTLSAASDTGEFLFRIEEALKGGVRTVQLREKGLDGRRLLEVACELRELTLLYMAKLFINDRVDVALLSGADGVHLPSSGLKAGEVRGLLGSRGRELLIGVSTHTLKEAKDSEREGADFITFGPVFFTQSKARYGEPVGINLLAQCCNILKVPVFALGGIDKERVGEVMGAGARGAAMISAILGAEDIQESAARVIEKVRK